MSLELSDWVGVVSARAKFDLVVHAVPHRRVLYAWSLFCELLDTEGEFVFVWSYAVRFYSYFQRCVCVYLFLLEAIVGC